MAATNQWDKTAPNYLTGAVPDEFDKMKYNFQWIQRVMMAIGFIPINGVMRQAEYNPDESLKRITFGGGTPPIAGQINYYYDVDGNLDHEIWSIDGKTMTITYTLINNRWDSDTVSIT